MFYSHESLTWYNPGKLDQNAIIKILYCEIKQWYLPPFHMITFWLLDMTGQSVEQIFVAFWSLAAGWFPKQSAAKLSQHVHIHKVLLCSVCFVFSSAFVSALDGFKSLYTHTIHTHTFRLRVASLGQSYDCPDAKERILGPDSIRMG